VSFFLLFSPSSSFPQVPRVEFETDLSRSSCTLLGFGRPFYWDIGFPDTQKVDMINEAAERIEEDKRARMEAEAR